MQAYSSHSRLTVSFSLGDLAATARLAQELSQLCSAGDVIALHGTLGAGKTSFAREFIQALGLEEEVPSPTFTLVQTYPLADHDADAIWHFDMYRINNPAEAYELDIEDAFEGGISLVEWPEKLGELLPEDCLHLHLTMTENEGERVASLDGGPNWAERLGSLTSALSELVT
jgi:tRNA threonylcarbamoyl adenosine modification protein YjeE